MNATALSKTIVALAALVGCASSGWAQDSFSVDMDLGTAGIQNTRTASPGDIFTVGIVLNVDAAGVSSYSVSSLFDTAELSLNGVTPAANNPALPGGLGSLAAPTWNNAAGWVHSFNGATLGLGPVSTSFLVGTITYQAVVPVNDGVADVTPGFFNLGIDGLFDNAGNPVAPTFNVGYVVPPVPEPSILALVVCAGLPLWFIRRRSLM